MDKKYCLCYYCQQIDPELSCLCYYLVLNNLISILEDNEINVIYTCSDGDKGYNILNEQILDIYFKALDEEGFDSALKAWKECIGIKHINDLLHCLKIARSRLLTGCNTLYCDSIDHAFSTESLEKVFLLGNTLTGI